MEDCICRCTCMSEGKRFFDLEEVRSLSITEVCAAFGISVNRGGFIKLRPEEKTASTKLYINKGNGHDRFYDFGSQKGGDCINLVQEYTQCSWQSALEAVADIFGIQPVNNSEYDQRGTLNNLQWAKLGIDGDMVTKNLDFDLERFSPESALKYAGKYQMTVNELRESNPSFYIAAIIRNRAFPHVYGLRNAYFMQIHSEQSFIKSITGNTAPTPSDRFLKEIEVQRKTVVTAEKLLRMALRGTDVKFASREYNVEKDWEDMLRGQISFEVGPKTNVEIKQYAQKEHLDVLYRKISVDEYYTPDVEDLEDASFAAFLKGETVNLVYTSKEAEQIDRLFPPTREDLHLVSSQEKRDLTAQISHAESIKKEQDPPVTVDVSR